MAGVEVLKNICVVYVEDDEFIRTSVNNLIRRRVKEIYCAENGKEGLVVIDEHSPDIIITDIEMPVMDGLEMIQEIRQKYGKKIPIIVVTAYQDSVHYTDQADGYIYKPINSTKLFELMSRFVS